MHLVGRRRGVRSLLCRIGGRWSHIIEGAGLVGHQEGWDKTKRGQKTKTKRQKETNRKLKLTCVNIERKKTHIAPSCFCSTVESTEIIIKYLISLTLESESWRRCWVPTLILNEYPSAFCFCGFDMVTRGPVLFTQDVEHYAD